MFPKGDVGRTQEERMDTGLMNEESTHYLYYGSSSRRADFRVRFKVIDKDKMSLTICESLGIMEWMEIKSFSAFSIPSHLRLAMSRAGLDFADKDCHAMSVAKALWDELRKEGWVQ